MTWTYMFMQNDVPNCAAMIRKLVHSFIGRLHASKNTYVDCISSGVDKDILFRSRLWQHWRKLLCIHYYSP